MARSAVGPLLPGRGAAFRLLALGLFLATQATAQPTENPWPMEASPLATGSRVRITAPSVSKRHAVGWVDHWTADSLLLRLDLGPAGSPNGSPASFSRSSIRKLETSKGMKGHAARGAWIGFLVGSVAGPFVATAALGEGADPYGTETDGEAVILVWAGTAVLCAVLGGFLGAAEKSERWKEVRGY